MLLPISILLIHNHLSNWNYIYNSKKKVHYLFNNLLNEKFYQFVSMVYFQISNFIKNLFHIIEWNYIYSWLKYFKDKIESINQSKEIAMDHLRHETGLIFVIYFGIWLSWWKLFCCGEDLIRIVVYSMSGL